MYDYLNILSDHPHIPIEAFLFQPERSNDPTLRDDFRIGSGKQMRRLLFEGWAVQTYTSYELQKLKQLQDYLRNNNIHLDPRWNEPWRLRFLLSTDDVQQCLQQMQIYIAFANRVRQLTFTHTPAHFLNIGVFYIAGRDCHYRPILVFDVQKIVRYKMTDDQAIETQTFFLEYVMRNYMIPGQVQSWVSLIDSAYQGLFDFIGSMKKSFTFLAETYRFRLFACYNVRITMSISMIWKIVKTFLDQETINKINLFEEQIPTPLLQYCNLSQLQQKFGGTMPNIKQGHFWPPRQVSKNYKCEKSPTKLLTIQEYTKYYEQKILYNTKFHEENIIKIVNNELRQNDNYHKLKKMQKQFKMLMEETAEEELDFNQMIAAMSVIYPPLNYNQMLLKNKNTPTSNPEG